MGVWHLDELPGLEFRVGGFEDDGVAKQVHSACPPTIGDDENPRQWTGGQEIAAFPEAAYLLLAAIADRDRMVTEAAELDEPAAADADDEAHIWTMTVPPSANGNGDGHASPFKITVPESDRTRYVRVALQREVEAFSNTPENQRHAYLLQTRFGLRVWSMPGPCLNKTRSRGCAAVAQEPDGCG